MLRVFQSATLEEQAQAVVLPWLHAQRGLPAQLPIMLTPSRAESFYWRGRLVAEGASLLGVRFWTPSDLRQALLRERSGMVIIRAALRLLARTLAAEYAQEMGDPFAQSIAAEPSGFLRTHERMIEAGWVPEQDGPAEMRALFRRLDHTLSGLNQQTQAGAHRALRERMEQTKVEPIFGDVLLVGFNATHGPLWDLLRAATGRAESVQVALLAPLTFGEIPEQLWINAWERVAESSAEISDPLPAARAPFAEAMAAFERGEILVKKTPGLHLLASADDSAQAQAIVAQTLSYLQEDSCQRLGLIFPQANALALSVAEDLRARGVPLNDSIGYFAPSFFTHRNWLSWLAWQEEGTAIRLLEWVRARESEGFPLADFSAHELARFLQNSLNETLLDRIDQLLPFWEAQKTSPRALNLARWLRGLTVWPLAAPFAEWIKLLTIELERWGWTEARDEILAYAPAWPTQVNDRDLSVERSAFFAWLREVTTPTLRTRGAEGNHFYGKVHLLLAAQIGGQSWSHLILAGMNEGVWPRDLDRDAFPSRHELEELNRRARQLNAETLALIDGENQTAGFNYLLISSDQRALAWRDLVWALENTSEKVALSAALKSGERLLLPSDLFAHFYQGQTGTVLDDAAMTRLAQETSAWIKEHGAILWPQASIPPEDIAATAVAFAARRNTALPFGRYEYAFPTPPATPIQMSVKDWEFSLQHPAASWWKNVVGVSSWPEEDLAWPLAVGTWVHRWLSRALLAGSNGENLAAQVAAQAELNRAEIRRAVPEDLPVWWEDIWRQALALTLDLAAALTPHLATREVHTELRLPPGLHVALPPGFEASFNLRGQPDLVLLSASPGEKLAGQIAWVIDYKTGNDDPLQISKLKKNEGWQPVLYGWALREMGAGEVQLSLLKPGAVLEPQLNLDHVLLQQKLFSNLARQHREGVFGDRPAGNEKFTFEPDLPLATLRIDNIILGKKWALQPESHPFEDAE